MSEEIVIKNIPCDDETKAYFSELAEKVSAQYKIAKTARALGRDVSFEVESKPSADLGERVENIIGPKGVAKRYGELYRVEGGKRDPAIFRLFEEILAEKWVSIPDREKRLEQAIKTCLTIITEGVVVAPIDGVPSVKISKNFDGSEFVDIYFAGPIRAAGGTAQVFPLILGDYARKLMNLDRYKPTEDEVERYVEECQIYEEIVTRQYKLSNDEVRAIARNCPVCINGEPTEEREVAAFKDLSRIASNRVRGGMCLVMSEGVALKARKILSFAKMLNLDWKWLEQIIPVDKIVGSDDEDDEANYKYLSRIAAGRPIFSYPSRKFGFRLRYGKGKNTGIMAKAIHPASMYLLDEFPAVATQLKVERPGKSAEIFPCDIIEGPVVKLENGEVRKISSAEEAILIKDRVVELIFLGDYLSTVGDFRKSAHPLVPAGYCEEWWALELEKLHEDAKKKNIEITQFIANPYGIDPYSAIELSMQLGIALHPSYLFYYNCADKGQILGLVKSAKACEKIYEGNKITGAIFENNDSVKKTMEDIGLPHKFENGKIFVEGKYAYPLLKTLGAFSDIAPDEGKESLGILSEISGMKIMDKCGSFIGLRMGRPEQAKAREMEGKPHVLFPVGFSGGNIRSINKASDLAESSRLGGIKAEMKIYYCGKCKKEIDAFVCDSCGGRAEEISKCEKCGSLSRKKNCEKCNEETDSYEEKNIPIGKMLEAAAKNLSMNIPDLVKGVKGLINEEKVAEPLEKGILRAKNEMHVYRDGTIRFDLINAPLTHFTPKEIRLSIEKLRELGYKKDVKGDDLEDENQMLELYVQDIILNEDAGKFLVRECNFIDELLSRYYKLEPLYCIKEKEELIGEVVLGLAPHTSAAVVGRIIGFTKARACFAHPYFHLAKRRNADGDQDSIMLLMDCLLNFSLRYLPITRGGRMDAPLVFTTMINPQEIDDEVYEMESCWKYPIELYENSLKGLPATSVEGIERVGNRLGTKKQYRGMGFTHNTAAYDFGPTTSRYVQLKSMEEKINRQAALQGKIRAVDKKDALERVLVSHFIPDIIGNARSFSKQSFRCTSCNEKYRRIPLSGKCRKCGKSNLVLTIAQGSVRKYLKIAKDLVDRHGLSNYLRQRINLIEQEVNSIFVSEKREQKSMLDYSEEGKPKTVAKSLFDFM